MPGLACLTGGVLLALLSRISFQLIETALDRCAVVVYVGVMLECNGSVLNRARRIISIDSCCSELAISGDRH